MKTNKQKATEPAISIVVYLKKMKGTLMGKKKKKKKKKYSYTALQMGVCK